MLELEKIKLFTLNYEERQIINGGEIPYSASQHNGNDPIKALNAIGNFLGGLFNGMFGN